VSHQGVPVASVRVLPVARAAKEKLASETSALSIDRIMMDSGWGGHVGLAPTSRV
jgi:hypothetical protein